MAPRLHTDDQIIEALSKHGSNRKAAQALGVNVRTLMRRKQQLALKGYSPEHDMTHTVPDGFTVRGVSTLYDKEGNPRMQWVKSQQDAEAIRRMIDQVIAGLSAEVPRAKPIRPPAITDASLLNCYVVTDYHMGMLAWRDETGADWDTQIAEDLLVAWFSEAVAEAPSARVGVLAQLGDFLHWDGWDAVTPTSRHLLDADTRFPKLVQVATRAIKRIIRLLLERHQEVRVIMVEGNHDMTSSVWLRQLCAAMFEDEPRVTVYIRPDPYYCIEHGQTALFFHHGHKKRLAAIDDVFVSKFRQVFGRTAHAYAHMGHLHHVDVKETNLMIVEQHRTLSAPDAHASRGGWLSGRDAQVITYSDVYGEVSRVRISSQRIIDKGALRA